MVVNSIRLGNKNDHAGVGQQQFTQPHKLDLNCNVSSRYLATTSHDRITFGRLYAGCSCSNI
jgi:hypothetical protein